MTTQRSTRRSKPVNSLVRAFVAGTEQDLSDMIETAPEAWRQLLEPLCRNKRSAHRRGTHSIRIDDALTTELTATQDAAFAVGVMVGRGGVR